MVGNLRLIELIFCLMVRGEWVGENLNFSWLTTQKGSQQYIYLRQYIIYTYNIGVRTELHPYSTVFKK